MALVKAPFTWPNSVDSSRSACSEPLFTGTNRRSERGELVWMALAISSLSVPVSPVIRMVERLLATCPTRSSRRSTCGGVGHNKRVGERPGTFRGHVRRCPTAPVSMLLYVQVRFEWDEAKSHQNRRKHGVDFEVAALVFDDPNHRSKQDRFVNGEERWQTIGLVNELLLVCHTWIEEDVVRIVSARKANRTERNRYYHGHRPL